MIHLLVSLKQSGLWPFLPFWEIPISPFYPVLTATQNGGISDFSIRMSENREVML